MDIHEATRSYEAWLRRCTHVVEHQLRDKHAAMRRDPFRFLRGTFYRWLQLLVEHCPEERRARSVLAVGDLHVESFGTWRDAEGRLAWGVDDFDESAPLPFTNDLIRLAASARIMIDAGEINLAPRAACDAILDGYCSTLRDRGRPLVLAEEDQRLELLGISELKPPLSFWRKLNERPALARGVPKEARQLLAADLPPGLRTRIVRRTSGIGSLGHARYVAMGDWDGGWIAREAKAAVPPASFWLRSRIGHVQPYYQRILSRAVRSQDPFQRCSGGYILRRLSPDSNPIDLDQLPADRDESVLLHAMGVETANVHLGTRDAAPAILRDLARRPHNWLRKSAKRMAKAVEKDWKKFRT